MSKATIATVKSFVRKNRSSLLVKVSADFDPMTDCVQYGIEKDFRPAVATSLNCDGNTLGIRGLWLVGRSRDSIQAFEKDGIRGFHIYNCCGSYSVGVAA